MPSSLIAPDQWTNRLQTPKGQEFNELLTMSARPSETVSVADLAQKYNVIMVHGITLRDAQSSSQWYKPGIDIEQKVAALFGLRPTICCSAIRNDDNSRNFYSPFGLILSGGAVAYAAPYDMGSILQGKNRVPSPSRILDKNVPIATQVDESLKYRDEYSRLKRAYNEIIVKDPSFGALYCFKDLLLKEQIEKAQAIAEKFKLPLICFSDGEEVFRNSENMLSMRKQPEYCSINIEYLLGQLCDPWRQRRVSIPCIMATQKGRELYYNYTDQVQPYEILTDCEKKRVQELQETYGSENVEIRAIDHSHGHRIVSVWIVNTDPIWEKGENEYLLTISTKLNPDSFDSPNVNQSTVSRTAIGGTVGYIQRPDMTENTLIGWINTIEQYAFVHRRNIENFIPRIGLKKSVQRWKLYVRVPGAILHGIADAAEANGDFRISVIARAEANRLLRHNRLLSYVDDHIGLNGALKIDPDQLSFLPTE